MKAPIPASILTGFLGAGKTTLLNYILRENHGYKFAIIVNEIGAIGIDGKLLVENREEEMVQLNNGCICCTVRKDLIQGVQKLVARGGFDYLLVETTGLAEPSPVAQTFLTLPQLQQHVRLDSIITVVDGEQLEKHLAAAEAAREQVAMADFLLLNKTDLLAPAEIDRAEARLREINPHATIFRTSRGQANLRELLDMHAFDLDRKLAVDPAFLDELRQHHHGEIGSFAFEFDVPFEPALLERYVVELGGREMVYRSKGIIHLEGTPRRAVFHGVNSRFTLFWDRLWEPGEARRSQLVFIGKNLSRERLERGLRECLA